MSLPRAFVIRRLVAVALLLLLGPATVAVAQTDSTAGAPPGERLPNLYDKLQLTGSISSVILNANIRLDGSGGNIGTDVDAEDDLGLDEMIFQPRAAVRWRPGRKHELEAGYQFARRTAEKSLERQIEFGDSTYDAGLDVKSTLDTDQLFINYRWAAFAKENWQAGVSIGLGALFLKMGLAAQANIGAGQAGFDVEKSLTGPLGSLGLYGRYLAGTRWAFEGDVRQVGIDIDRFDIKVFEANAAARYFLQRQWGLEAGLGTSKVTVDIANKEGRDFSASGRVKYSLANVRLGVVWVP